MPNTSSPLRYPGGKFKLSPLIKYIITNKTNHIDTYIEPFAGGAGVALELLFSGTVKNVIINDYDKSIYSFWRAVITEPERFIQEIISTPITINEWNNQKEKYLKLRSKYSFELGFATFFLNRTNRSGILSAGPIGGYNQIGKYRIDARFNKINLIDKIKRISEFRTKIKVYNKDIRKFITQVIKKSQDHSFVYFDPPYYVKGEELYINYFQDKDHLEIRDSIVDNLYCPWLITYDVEDYISNIYANYHQRLYDLTYSLANKGKASELLIFSDKSICPQNTELADSNIRIRLLKRN